MSRIRTVKPDFWTSAQVIECSPNARLLFIGLWNFCDDKGRHPASAKQAKAEVFPADDISIENVARLIDELSTNGLIARYHVDDTEYFYVTGWRHQKIDRPQEPKYPEPLDEDSTNVRSVKDRIGREGKVTESREAKDISVRGKEWFEQLETELLEASGLENHPSASLRDTSPIVMLIDKGYDLSRDILPVLRASKAKGKKAETWRYFVKAIEESRATNDAIKPNAKETPVVDPKTVWLPEDDPRWCETSDAVYAKTGKRITANGSREQHGTGAYVPKEFVPTPRNTA